MKIFQKNVNRIFLRNKFDCLKILTIQNKMRFSNLEKHLLYINTKTKLEELKYKEEIFEYLNLYNNRLSENEILKLLKKMEKSHVLENEIKDFKCFFRNLLEVKEIFRNREVIVEIIKFFLDKLKQIQELLRETKNTEEMSALGFRLNMEHTEYDKDFTNILKTLSDFVSSNLEILIIDRESLRLVFHFYNELYQEFDSDLTNIYLKLTQYLRAVDTINDEKVSFDDTVFILSCILSAYNNQCLNDDSIVKFILNFYILKYYDSSKQGGSIFKQENYDMSKLNELFMSLNSLQLPNNVEKEFTKINDIHKNNLI
jgi:hypothetical protein